MIILHYKLTNLSQLEVSWYDPFSPILIVML